MADEKKASGSEDWKKGRVQRWTMARSFDYVNPETNARETKGPGSEVWVTEDQARNFADLLSEYEPREQQKKAQEAYDADAEKMPPRPAFTPHPSEPVMGKVGVDVGLARPGATVP